jgi:UPF0176 protein
LTSTHRSNGESPVAVAALYRFVPLPDRTALHPRLLAKMKDLGVRGTLLLAAEGINGTVAGPEAAVEALIATLRGDPRLADLDVKRSRCDRIPFRKARVKLKSEIVTMGVSGIDPNQNAGTYVDPEEWNELIDRPGVTLIDTRNEYEVAVGTFRRAINPRTQSFREFPEYVSRNLDPREHPTVAMYCTGGIRCEKATAYLKRQGFENVYHLRGGILRYLETVPEENSRWQGDCFVFDERVAVDHRLRVTDHAMCFGCGWAVSPEDQRTADYRPGVHCPQCVDRITPDQRRRFAERQRQIEQTRG